MWIQKTVEAISILTQTHIYLETASGPRIVLGKKKRVNETISLSFRVGRFQTIPLVEVTTLDGCLLGDDVSRNRLPWLRSYRAGTDPLKWIALLHDVLTCSQESLSVFITDSLADHSSDKLNSLFLVEYEGGVINDF